MKIYETRIKPVAGCDGETWTLAKQENETLVRFERKIVRRDYGSVEENDEWRVRNNQETDKLLMHKYIVRFIKTQRIQWSPRTDG